MRTIKQTPSEDSSNCGKGCCLESKRSPRPITCEEDSLGVSMRLSNCVKEGKKPFENIDALCRFGLATSVRQTLQALADLVTGNPDADANAAVSVRRKSTKHSKSESAVSVLMPSCRPGPPPVVVLRTWLSNTAEAAPSLHFSHPRFSSNK